MSCCTAYLLYYPGVYIYLQLHPLVLGQQLHRAVLVLPEVRPLQGLGPLTDPGLQLTNLDR